MALPLSHEPHPDPVPPPAEPGAIRACLSNQMRYEFDSEWDFVLEQAKRTHSLVGIEEMLLKWRHMAFAELKDPGSHYRLMAKAEQILASGKAPEGSISGEEMLARIRARFAS